MFRLMTLAFILFMINIAQAQQTSRYYATIKIWAEKYELQEFEETFIHIEVENHDEKGPRVDGSIGSDLHIKNDQGEIIMPTISLSYLSAEQMGVEKREFLSGFLGRYGSMTDNNQYLPPGQYSIYCEWNSLYYEPIISNQIQIRINAPAGEEKTALEEYRKAQLLFDQRKWKLYEERLDDFISRFPSSPYAAMAVKDKIFVYQFLKKDEEGYIALNKQLVERYPNNSNVPNAVREIYKYYERKNKIQERIQYFDKLMKNKNDSKLNQKIQQVKEKMEAEKKPAESIQTNQEIEIQRK